VGWLLAISGGLLYIHQRDARLRAEGEARVYAQKADSLTSVADSFKTAARKADERADSVAAAADLVVMQAEEVVAEIEARENAVMEATDATVDLLAHTLPEGYESIVDSLRIDIEMERLLNNQMLEQFLRVIESKDNIITAQSTQILAKEQQISALEQALAARVSASTAMERSQTGFLEKTLYAVVGVTIGYTISQLGGF